MNKEIGTILAIETFLKENVLVIDEIEYYKDTAIAKLYSIKLDKLHKTVKANPDRFPSDFFKTLPNGDRVFSYAGVLMLGGLLKSKRVIHFQIKLIEHFVERLHETTGMSVFDLLAKINR